MYLSLFHPSLKAPLVLCFLVSLPKAQPSSNLSELGSDKLTDGNLVLVDSHAMPHFLWEKNIITRRVQGCLVWSGFGSDVSVLVLLSGLGWSCPVVRDAVHILQSTCHARSALAIVTLTKTRNKFRALGTHFSLDYCCSSLPTWNEFNELKTS